MLVSMVILSVPGRRESPLEPLLLRHAASCRPPAVPTSIASVRKRVPCRSMSTASQRSNSRHQQAVFRSTGYNLLKHDNWRFTMSQCIGRLSTVD